MKQEFESDYDIGEKAFAMHNNEIREIEVKKITCEISEDILSVMFTVSLFHSMCDTTFDLPAGKLFKTKDDLVFDLVHGF